MQFNTQLGLSRFIGRRDGRRIPGRVAQELLVSDLGPVLDLSAGGMRILSTRPPNRSQLDVRLKGPDSSLRVRAKVAWCRRLGFRRHEIGMTFVELDDSASAILNRISQAHRARSAV